MSKYTFFNRILPDAKFITTLVSQLYEDFEYNFNTQTEEIKDMVIRLKEVYKIEIKYIFADFEDGEVVSKYGIKKTTDIYAKKFPGNYYIVFNKKNNFTENRFLFLKVLAYILFDKLATNEEIRLTIEATVAKEDLLAEEFAVEFLIPKWKFQILKKQHPDADDVKWLELLKQLNSRLLTLRKKNM